METLLTAQHNENLFLREKVFELKKHLNEVYQKIAIVQERVRKTSLEFGILEGHSQGIILRVIDE